MERRERGVCVCVCVFVLWPGGVWIQWWTPAYPGGEVSVCQSWHFSSAVLWPQVISLFVDTHTRTEPSYVPLFCFVNEGYWETSQLPPVVGVSRYLSTTIYTNGRISSGGPGTDVGTSSLQVSCYSVHWEPLHHPAAEEDCSVSERHLRGQVRCGRHPEWRLQNAAQPKQAEGQDTHQSKNNPVALTDVEMMDLF